MAQTYTASIAHHSVSSAPEIEITGTLAQAKRAAAERFGGGFADHKIIIRDAQGYTVASRKMDGKRWTNA